MKNVIKKSACIFFVLLILCSCVPFFAFADPVSATIMANAFAQAIAAYGASNGVAMTFDVANSNGIGQSVHELWETFRSGQQQADDYATLAAALFPDLYYKAASAVAGASDVYSVGVHISDTYAEEFDNFYNWLLSGPAEMVQVDNEYYQFQQAQIGDYSVPINVLSLGTWAGQPIPVFSSPSTSDLVSSGRYCFRNNRSNTAQNEDFYIGANSNSVYAFIYFSSNVNIEFVSLSSYSGYSLSYRYSDPNYVYNNVNTWSSTYNSSYQCYLSSWNTGKLPANVSDINLPQFSSQADGINAVLDMITNGDSSAQTIGVKAYTNTGIADIPDTSDPNYDALNRAKDIPLNVPWDESLYGDGTGTLTDAQTGAIAQTIDGDLVQDGIIDLAGTTTDDPGGDPGEDDPSDDPDDYAVLGLDDVFPFCIPFDIYNFLSALAAEPVAPHFTAQLDFPDAIGGTRTIDIDFDNSTFNQLAQLLRLLELLAFIVGLAFVTRSMFIRG